MNKLLVVVDYQCDFVNGALGFAGAEALEAGIAGAVESTLDGGGYVLFTRDTHGPEYLTTREGRFLPVPHCLEGGAGHALYGRLNLYEQAPRTHVELLNKPTFGSGAISEAAKRLCGGAPDEIEMCGLVTDICVVANTLILHSAFTAARVAVLTALCGSGNAAGAQKALDVLAGMGIELV